MYSPLKNGLARGGQSIIGVQEPINKINPVLYQSRDSKASYASAAGFDIISNKSNKRHSVLNGLAQGKNTASHQTIHTFNGGNFNTNVPGSSRRNNESTAARRVADEYEEPDFLQ